MQSTRIDPSHPIFAQLVRKWINDGKPGKVTYQGVVYQHVTDNDDQFFIVSGHSAFDARYEGNSFR